MTGARADDGIVTAEAPQVWCDVRNRAGRTHIACGVGCKAKFRDVAGTLSCLEAAYGAPYATVKRQTDSSFGLAMRLPAALPCALVNLGRPLLGLATTIDRACERLHTQATDFCCSGILVARVGVIVHHSHLRKIFVRRLCSGARCLLCATDTVEDEAMGRCVRVFVITVHIIFKFIRVYRVKFLELYIYLFTYYYCLEKKNETNYFAYNFTDEKIFLFSETQKNCICCVVNEYEGPYTGDRLTGKLTRGGAHISCTESVSSFFLKKTCFVRLILPQESLSCVFSENAHPKTI